MEVSTVDNMMCSVLSSYVSSKTYLSVANPENFKVEFQHLDLGEVLFQALSEATEFKMARKRLSEYMTTDGLKKISARFAKYKYSQTNRKGKSHLYLSKSILGQLESAKRKLGFDSNEQLLEYVLESGYEWPKASSEVRHTRDLDVIFSLLPFEVKAAITSRFESIATTFFYKGARSVPVDLRKKKAFEQSLEIALQDNLRKAKINDWRVSANDDEI